jgi:hypothetical protein
VEGEEEEVRRDEERFEPVDVQEVEDQQQSTSTFTGVRRRDSRHPSTLSSVRSNGMIAALKLSPSGD